MAILSDGSYDSEAGVKSFKKQIADVADPMPEFYNLKSEESDYETIVNKLKTGGYQAIIMFTNEFNKQLTIPLLESKAIIYEAAPVILLNNRKYNYPVKVINAANNQHEYLLLANFLKLEYDLNPTVYSVFVYDACQLIMRNIDITKGNPQEISKNLSDLTSYAGISGSIYFDDHGNLGRKIQLTQVK